MMGDCAGGDGSDAAHCALSFRQPDVDAPPPGRDRFVRALVIDDDEVNRRVVADMLAVAGAEALTASDGSEGLLLLDGNDVDFVLLDLRMPDMDGLSVLRRIRARDDEKASLPVVMVTADVGSEAVRLCRSAGADHVLAKPVAMYSLFEAIGTSMAGREGYAGVR